MFEHIAVKPLQGDADSDGEITVADAQRTLDAAVHISAGNDSGLTDVQFAAADVSGDGAVTIEDAQFILTYYTRNSLSGRSLTWDQVIG